MKENRNNTDLLMEEGTMTIESFMDMMKDALSARIEACTVEAQEVTKNNGVIRHGIRIKEPENNVAPCIYLDNAFKAYQGGRSFDEIVNAVVEDYEESRISGFDITMVRDFERAEERMHQYDPTPGRHSGRIRRTAYIRAARRPVIPAKY